LKYQKHFTKKTYNITVLVKYADYAYFVYSSNPWFKRGAWIGDGSNTGVFAFSNNTGYSNGGNGFRVVLCTIF